MAEVQAFSQGVLMRAGNYVHLFLYSPNESGGHIPTNSIEVVCACIFVVQIYILITYVDDQRVESRRSDKESACFSNEAASRKHVVRCAMSR